MPRPASLFVLSSLVASVAVAPVGAQLAQQGEIEAQLREGRYLRAMRLARSAVEGLVQTLPGASADARPLAAMLALQALAEAGSAETGAALWTWAEALSLDPSLATVDHSRFGPAAAVLAASPLRAAAADGQLAADEPGTVRNLFEVAAGARVALPRPDRTPPPDYPEGARAAGIAGPVILQVVVDRQGRPSSPLVLDSPSPVLAWAAAEAVREWRFEPAELGGRPVAVAFNLRIDFRPR
jgi:TonB family protein